MSEQETSTSTDPQYRVISDLLSEYQWTQDTLSDVEGVRIRELLERSKREETFDLGGRVETAAARSGVLGQFIRQCDEVEGLLLEAYRECDDQERVDELYDRYCHLRGGVAAFADDDSHDVFSYSSTKSLRRRLGDVAKDVRGLVPEEPAESRDFSSWTPPRKTTLGEFSD